MEANTIEPGTIWISFLALGLVGSLLTAWRPWLFVLVVAASAWLAWSRLRDFPPSEMRTMIDPSIVTVVRTLERHTYVAAGASITLAALGLLWRRRSRPTV